MKTLLLTLAVVTAFGNVLVTRALINRAVPPRIQAQLAVQEKEAQLQIRAAKLRDDYLTLHPELRQQPNAPVNVSTTPENATPPPAQPAPSVTVTEKPAPRK